MTVEEFRFTKKDLKAYRNLDAESALADAVTATILLNGSAYEAAVTQSLREHSVNASILLDDGEPVWPVPLRWVIPIEKPQSLPLEDACRTKESFAPGSERILKGGLLITTEDEAVFAWQEFRSSGLGKIGLADACGVVTPYDDIEEVSAAGDRVGLKTADGCWALVLQKSSRLEPKSGTYGVRI